MTITGSLLQGQKIRIAPGTSIPKKGGTFTDYVMLVTKKFVLTEKGFLLPKGKDEKDGVEILNKIKDKFHPNRRARNILIEKGYVYTHNQPWSFPDEAWIPLFFIGVLTIMSLSIGVVIGIIVMTVTVGVIMAIRYSLWQDWWEALASVIIIAINLLLL